MYLSKPASPSKSATDSVLREICDMKLQQESTLLNIKTITDDVEGVAKFVKDFWNSTNREKQIALDRLTRILRELKSLNNASRTTDLSRRAKPGHNTRDKL